MEIQIPKQDIAGTDAAMARDRLRGLSPRQVSACVMAVSLIALSGWALGLPVLASFVPGGVTMKANTAFGLGFAALSLWCLASTDGSRQTQWLGRLCALLTLLIGALTVAEYLGLPFSIDELAFRAATDMSKTATPGRMAASTAGAFIILGCALLTLDVTIRRIRISQLLTILGMVVPLTTLLGYAYAVIPFVGLGQGVQMAVHTAICFILLHIGILIARPLDGFMRTLTSRRAGGAMARRLIPYAFLLPLVLGALRMAGETAGWYDVPLGSALVAVATMLVLAALIWRTAYDLNHRDEAHTIVTNTLAAEQRARADAERARARAEEAEHRLVIIAEASHILAASLDFRMILERLAWVGVPIMADWCFVDLVTEDGHWQRAAIGHADPDGQALADQFRDQLVRWPARRVIKHENDTGMVLDNVLRAMAIDTTPVETLRSLKLHSYVTIPLVARDRILGAVTFLGAAGRAPYTSTDIALLEELVRRGAIAIDNARLYQEAVIGAQTKTEFLATISHELRTPLTAIVGYTALFEDGIPSPLDAEQADQMTRIRQSADHLLSLIDEILTFAKLESGRMSVSYESVIVSDALEEAAAFVAPLAEPRGLELSVSAPEDSVIIETDATKLRQILVNLLSNAVKFTDRGTVALRAWVDGADVVFEVRDTGIGIAKEDFGRMFDAFTQLDQRLTRRSGGIGLGLGVVRKLVTLLGGEISVASRPGRGSTFYVRLPIAKIGRGTAHQMEA